MPDQPSDTVGEDHQGRVKLVCLLSGGIDSPVAAYRMGKRGGELVLLHMDNASGGGEELKRVTQITRLLEDRLGRRLALYHLPHYLAQQMVADRCDRCLQCVLCKRFMLRTAGLLSQKIGALGVVTGDSLGQVASQTLHNIRAAEHGLGITVLRPLVGLDKLEIEEMAKSIGTYEVSIGSPGRCPFLPSRPRTRAGIDVMLREEGRLPVNALVREILDGMDRISP